MPVLLSNSTDPPATAQGAGDNIVVLHGGQQFTFDPRSTAEAIVMQGRDYYDGQRRLIYECELSGAHEGPSIKIKMVGVGLEYDENGRHGCWEQLVYADNDERIDDVVDDFYHDAIRDDLEEIIRETWD